ncbi:MAG: SH3 domain-containing protein, partial [Bacteroidota bacterium]
RVNIRSYPSLQSGVLIQLNTGDICRILEKSELVNVNGTNDYWYKINCNGNVGWVFGAFTTLILNDPASNSSANSNNQTAIAIINRVFFYSSPNINTKTSLYIVKNQSVEIITNNGDFWGVTFTYNNKTTSGYMLKNELRL